VAHRPSRLSPPPFLVIPVPGTHGKETSEGHILSFPGWPPLPPQAASLDRFGPEAIFPVQVGESICQPVGVLDSHVPVGRNLVRVVQPRVSGLSHNLCAQMVNDCCPVDLLMAWSYLHGSRVQTTGIRDGVQRRRQSTTPDRTQAVLIDETFLPAEASNRNADSRGVGRRHYRVERVSSGSCWKVWLLSLSYLTNFSRSSRVSSRPDLDPLRLAGTPTSYLCPTWTPNVADTTEWSISHEPFFPLFVPTLFPIHSSLVLDFLLFGLLMNPTHTILSSDDTIVALYLYHRLTHILSCHSVTVTLTHVVYIV